MPYRTELKRPDLKGNFPCSVCGKIFCHSSSLSRHRMQAHFKSYQCRMCNQEIASNETLRSHMFRNHQISRMFMCRCCNWAFPDKTSLHIHMQSMMRNGTPGDVQILAKSNHEAGSAIDPDMMKQDGFLEQSPSPLGSDEPLSPGELHMDTKEEPSDAPDQSDAQAQLSAQLAASMPPNSIFPSIRSRDEIMLGGMRQGQSNQQTQPTLSQITQAAMQAAQNMASKSLIGNAQLPTAQTQSIMEMASTNPYLAAWLANNLNPYAGLNLRSPQLVGSQLSGASSPAAGHNQTGHASAAKKARKESHDDTLEINVAGTGAGNNDSYMTECSETINCDLNGNLDEQHLPTAQNLVSHNRSAISSNPITSLMYRKKVTNALKKQKDPQKLEHSDQLNNNSLEQRSPGAQSDSQTSSSGAPMSSGSDSSSPLKALDKCTDCQDVKSRLALAQSRNSYLESKTSSLENKIKRLESHVAGLEASSSRYEAEHKVLRAQCEQSERQLLCCQEKALLFAQSAANFGNVPQKEGAVNLLLEDLLSSTTVHKAQVEV